MLSFLLYSLINETILAFQSSFEAVMTTITLVVIIRVVIF